MPELRPLSLYLHFPFCVRKCRYCDFLSFPINWSVFISLYAGATLISEKLTPSSNSMDTFSEAQTFGTLIQKYEEERPLPKIDPELEDVDKIGLYIDVFFKGHICKVLGIGVAVRVRISISERRALI